MAIDPEERDNTNRFRSKKQGALIPQSVTMYLDDFGTAFHGWENLSIQKSIESFAHGFTFQIPQKYAGESSKLPPGTKITIYVNDERVTRGRIERVDYALAAQTRAVQITGRSLSADLVDCTATPKEYSNVRIDRLAKELVKPFGLQVLLSVDPGIVPKIAVKPGDTVFEVLDKAARMQGFFWLTTRAGNIRLTRAGRLRADSRIAEDVNLQSGSATIDDSKRFSEYTVKASAPGSDDYPGVASASAEGKAFDQGVDRFRPLIIVAEGNADAALAKKRAQWEATSRLGQSVELNLVVQGWQQETGILWGMNQIMAVKSPSLGLDGDFLSTSVEHIRSNGEGTITRMGLTRKDAYSPEPIIPKSGAGAGSLEAIVAFSQRNPQTN